MRADALIIPDIERAPTGIRARLSRRVIPVDRVVRRRFELARITYTDRHVGLIRRVWQLVSGSTEAGQEQVTDPGFLAQLEAVGRVRLRWHLTIDRLDNDRNLPAFPQDGAFGAALAAEQPEGWVDAPLMYAWGADSTTRRIRISGQTAARLYCDIEQEDGTITAIGGLLEADDRLALDTPDFRSWWEQH